MTRHNLAIHIAWLLSHEVLLPADDSSTAQNISNITNAPNLHIENILEEEDIDEEIIRQIPSPSSIRPNNQLVNVVQQFVRPPLPASVLPKSQIPSTDFSLTEGSMGKLASSSKPSRPRLLSQRQLATPASTTSTFPPSTSTASLTQNFSNFLKQQNNDTPSRTAGERLLPKPARHFQTPRTPSHTPRPPLQVKTENVESVDLTGDKYNSDPVSRSSSAEVVFGEPILLWAEGPASRAEPLPRTSKKRKSDDISSGTPGRRQKAQRPAKEIKQDLDDGFDEFMDIDDFDPRQSQQDHDRKALQAPRSILVKPSIEVPDADHRLEEYQITETITRVESRTRKGISRVPSFTENGPSNRPTSFLSPKALPPGNTPRTRSMVQVEASPTNRSVCSPVEHPPSRRKQKRHTERTIQDSDEDGLISDVEKRVSCSPRPSVKKSPRVVDILKTLQREDSHKIGSIDHRLRDTRNPSRVDSPLRPISRNVASRPENAPSPFHKDSPTKGPITSRFSNPPTSQQTPSSTLPGDVKRLVSLYLKQPSVLAPYSRRVAAAKNQNGNATMEYFDRDELPPRSLKEERERLLLMDQAYATLMKLEEEYRASIERKKELKRRLCGELDTDDDSNTLEQIAALTQDIGRIEKEVGRHLITSGAISDGFGTDETVDISQNSLPPSSRAHDATIPRASGASTVGSAQVILQTQIPSLPQRSIESSNRLPQEKTVPQCSSRGLQDRMPGNVSYPISPSPVRQAIPVLPITANQISFGSRENSAPAGKAIRQPNFIRDPSPVNYDFDNDAFDDLLLEEQEIQHGVSRKEGFDDDYGDFSDDDDLLEMTDEVEKRHSLPRPTSRQSARKDPSETSRGTVTSRNRDKPNASKNMYSHVDTAHSQMLKYAWSNDVKKALKERFKLSGFRQNQLDAINATLNAEDAFVLMPTGGGKSLCYQLPAIIQSGKTKGVTIVISPLLSLMIDQVGHLQAINIRAATLNGETSTSERNEIFDQLSENHPEQYIQLLYITPEMIGKSEKMLSTLSRLHANKKLARIVIDEAHCVSQWGHDFRPDYVALKQVRERFPRVPLMALTATATENVKLDVMHNLGMGKCPVYSQSFNRPNLHYEVRSKKGKGKAKEILDEIADLIKNRYRGQTGIIYTLSRKNCEQIAEKLSNEYGISAHHYHASLPPEDKKAIQEDWQRGVLQVVVATIAFGMGIDKPDVRFVIHHTIPKSLEGYYQETGRAGRDGQKSECFLYYGYQDTAILKDFIYKSEASEEQKERQRKMLTSMVRYCENRSDCRRVQVLAYFGESFEKKDCGHSCDNCNSKAVFQTIDFTSEAQAAIRIVKQLQKSNVTLLHCVDILRGSNAGKIKTLNHNQLSDFGFAKSMDRSDIERLFFRLLMENALEEHNVMNKSGFATAYIHLGPNCREFHTGRRHVSLQIKISGSPPVPARKQPPPKQATKQSANTGMNYPSTHFTSPISSPSKGKGKNAIRPVHHYEEDDNTTDDDFVVDDDEEEAFEPMRKPVRSRRATSERLGPPITADRRLAALPEVHRDIIHCFTAEAKELEEKLRNRTQAKKPFFTELNFREMAIEWTTSIEAMREIPGINIERVDKYGLQFIPMILRYHSHYEEMMNSNMPQNRDIDINHQNVIDLVSDEEEEEADEEEDFGINDEDDDPDIRAAELGSKYFQTPTTKSKGTRKLPSGWSKDASTKTTEKKGELSRSGGEYSDRGSRGSRGGKKSFNRGSYRSTSGSSGVSKRRNLGGGRRGRGSKPTSYVASRKNNSGLMQQFGHSGGGRGCGSGGGGGGIGMMPT
ncbi:hypothetical protein B0J14DRAFT_705069 [Halenospora varia]|nr:hypothetical protein B0J14DRAFT_705069 [Halenospora varia]